MDAESVTEIKKMINYNKESYLQRWNYKKEKGGLLTRAHEISRLLVCYRIHHHSHPFLLQFTFFSVRVE